MDDIKLEKPQNRGGIIAFFANNPVAANLLMIFIIVMGLASFSNIQRQLFPSMTIPWVNIYVTYPGASPKEIEEGVIEKIEDSLKAVTEITEIQSRAFRNSARISLRIDKSVEMQDVVDEIKNQTDGISNYPNGMEPIRIEPVEITQQAVEMVVVGDYDLAELKLVARDVERELLSLNNVSLVRVSTAADEIAIEVDPERLREYGLTVSDVSNAVARNADNFSAGQIQTDSGVISVRVENRRYTGQEFANIPVKLGAQGAKVLLSDVATIRDGFVEGEMYSKYSGKNAIFMSVSATEAQSIDAVANSVTTYIEQRNKTLGPDIQLEVIVDTTYYLNGRLNMMLKNLLQGAFLVAIMLSIFLRFKLALWVMVGLPVCFLGAVFLMPVFGVTINIVSLFAFIMVLGIVVDDAIVIGESVYTEIEESGHSITNVVAGAKRVATPATFGVLTTIAVFSPFVFASGPEGSIFKSIALVSVLCLIFSLIESKLILPAHLAHTKFSPLKPNGWRVKFNRQFDNFVNGPYKSAVKKAIEYRWATFMAFAGLLAISCAMIAANHVRVIPQPKVPHDFLEVNIEMVQTVSDERTIEVLKQIENLVLEEDQRIEQEFGQKMIRDRLVVNQGRTEGFMLMPLVDEDVRPMDTFELARRIRENLPVIAGMKSIYIKEDVTANNDGDFSFVIYGKDFDTLNEASIKFAESIRKLDGVYDVSTTVDPSSKEIQMTLKPEAYDLGLTLGDISRQTGVSFYGGEAQRFIRNSEEVRVMVKYPQLSRERVSDLKFTLIKTPRGEDVMLGDVVNFIEASGVNYIRRINGYRSVYIWGNIDENQVEPGPTIEKMSDELLPQIVDMYPSVKSELGQGVQEQQAQEDEQLMFFVAAMLMVYILLAIPLKSYSQPLIIMSVIPFSLTGAIWGHYWMGLNLSLMSFFGLIAAAGVVINDSLVMTDFVNQRIKQGLRLKDAVVDAGCARFRAITLTSITTFVGVLPLLFETSLQAQFVVPMAVGLGFAVVFATLVTLVLVPCLYIILLDIGAALNWLRLRIVALLKPIVIPILRIIRAVAS